MFFLFNHFFCSRIRKKLCSYLRNIQGDLIEKIQEYIQLLIKSKEEEQTRLELSQLRNELHETKMDLLYQKATLNHLKREQPELSKDQTNHNGAMKITRPLSNVYV